MSSDTTARVNGTAPTDPEELRAEIARTRQELGETAAALAAKADVKSRAKASAADFKARVQGSAADASVRVKQRAAATAGQTAILAGSVREQVALSSDKAREQLLRRPVPVAVIAAVTTAAAVAVFLIRRARR